MGGIKLKEVEMTYRIRDLQFEDAYFAGGELFQSKRDICERLINYHSIDCNMRTEIKLLGAGKVKECLNRLMAFGWRVEKE